MKIAVLAGGYSPERDVSLVSAGLISAALCRKGHKVALIDVYKGVECDDPGSLFTDEINVSSTILEKEPDLAKLKKEYGCGDALVGKNVIEVCRLADIVYIGLHGGMGENGQIQALLDCHGLKYTGTGYIGATLAMDKEITKKMFDGAGIKTPYGKTYTKKTADAVSIEKEIGYPCVIKPCSCGSSVGVSIVGNRRELETGLEKAFEFEGRVLVERRITGREMTVAILLGRVLPPVEIIPKNGFYDYKNKYQSGMTDEICPPDNFSDEMLETLSSAAKAAAKALFIDEDSYCRADFIVAEDGTPYCLEVNTLPGMTPLSLLPREARAVGIEYDDLCDMIAKSAFDK